MTRSLSSKVALVTGGGAGLGRAISDRLTSDGATVIISDIDAETGQTSAEAIGATYVNQDVRDEARWATVISEIEERFGKLDILVNNAGVLGPYTEWDPEHADYSEWKRIFEVNVDGVFLGCRAAIPAMRRAGGGGIVNMASIAGLMATPYAMAYGATKACVRHMTRSVAQYCAEQGLKIRCNSVHPGDVRTPLRDRQFHEMSERTSAPIDDLVAEAEALVPLGELVSAEQVAASVSFLLSDDARFITGEMLVVDGGLTQCDSFHLASSAKHRLQSRRSGN